MLEFSHRQGLIIMGDNPEKVVTCGLVMPISAIEDCTTEHWLEVKDILIDSLNAVSDFKFKIDLVSNADEIGVIQRRIVQNIYHSDIVICDVSAKNPNVMFELGMRLAFDKPTVIIKDDKTNYSFDTAVIEHITYPRDLRFAAINRFKQLLGQKVKSTYLSGLDPNNSVFLKNFGTFHVAKINDEIVSPNEAILKSISDLQAEILNLRRNITSSGASRTYAKYSIKDKNIENHSSKLNFILDNFRRAKKTNPTWSSNDIVNDPAIAENIFNTDEGKFLFADKDDFIEAYDTVKRLVLANGI